MDDALKQLLEDAAAGLQRPVTEAASLHPSFYTDEGVFEAELEAVFANGWLGIARSSEIPKSGDWKVVSSMNQQILITRDKTGSANAMSPACRHKWAMVAEGSGSGSRLVCPYHRWSYDLTGRLRGAPLWETNCIPEENRQLALFGCEEWLGWIFVNLDRTAPPLAPGLRAVEDKVRPWQLERLVPLLEPLRFEGGYNWKTLCDNVGESYHVIGTHPVSVKPYADLDRCAWDTDGSNWCLSDVPNFGRRKVGLIGPTLASPVDEFSGTWTYNVYPCHIFGLAEDFVVWQRLDVRGPGDVSMELTVLGAPEMLDHPEWKTFAHEMRTSIRDIEEEDQIAFRSSFKGQRLGHGTAGPFHRNEEGTLIFQRWWVEAMLKRVRRSAPASPPAAGRT